MYNSQNINDRRHWQCDGYRRSPETRNTYINFFTIAWSVFIFWLYQIRTWLIPPIANTLTVARDPSPSTHSIDRNYRSSFPSIFHSYTSNRPTITMSFRTRITNPNWWGLNFVDGKFDKIHCDHSSRRRRTPHNAKSTYHSGGVISIFDLLLDICTRVVEYYKMSNVNWFRH